MLGGSFSGTLLDADLLSGGSGAPGPAFLATTPAAGAACDPGAFLVGGGSEPDSSLQPAAPGSPAGREGQPPLPRARASASDLLRELESSTDFLLPTSADGLDPADGLLLGGGSGSDGGASGGGSAYPWQAAFSGIPIPTIPEEAEAEMVPAQLQDLPGLPPATATVPPAAPAVEAAVHAAAAAAAIDASSAAALVPSLAPQLTAGQAQPQVQPPLSLFIPSPTLPPATAATTAAPVKAFPDSPVSALLEPAGPVSEAPSPTASSGTTSSAAGPPEAQGGAGAGAAASSGGVPRIASMPNLHLSLGDASSREPVPRTRRHAASRRAIPRSRSHDDLNDGGSPTAADLARYNVPHMAYLTPPHLRRGKGGRQPATDPRLDPRIDPKKARRIMANRLSAAKSKLKQKSAAQAERQKMEMMRMVQGGQSPAAAAAAAEAKVRAEQQELEAQLQALEQQLAAHTLPAQPEPFAQAADAPPQADPMPWNF